MTTATIDTLKEKLGELADVGSALSVLSWDQETYLPPKGFEARGRQLGTLAAIRHRMFTAPEFGHLLNSLRDKNGSLSPDESKLVSETLWDYDRATKFPEDYVKEFAEKQSKAFQAWKEAKSQSKYEIFRPHLANMVDLARRAADMIGYSGSPYNALLEEYERGMTAERLRVIFGDLAKKQKDLVARIVASKHQPDLAWTKQDWDIDAQWRFGLRVVGDLGFDLEAGRQDKAAHPFCTTFDIQDVRLTTRLHRDMLFSSLMSSMHEMGHGLYEQGFNVNDRRTTLAGAPSLGMHESQSRLWENVIGRSRQFWTKYLPVLREEFPNQLDNISVDQVWRAINHVQPSLIRVEADECTYNLHVIIRFEIEVEILEGRLDLKDLPAYWNSKYKEYLGVDVPNDAKGCLQDVHWAHGSFGYFPTYSLGNLYCAQLFDKFMTEVPNFWSQVESGDTSALLNWLRKNVHRVGRRKMAPEIVKDVTGREPESAPYLRYLESKYGELYKL